MLIFLKDGVFLLNLDFINEPRLQFAEGRHICARQGITSYGVYDKGMEVRRSSLNIGAVGSSACLDALNKWLEICAKPIESIQGSKQPNLFFPFCGFNLDQGFYSKFICNNELNRQIRNIDIDDILSIKNRDELVRRAIDLYYEEVKFLALNKPVDVIVCILPKRLYEKIVLSTPNANHEELEESVSVSVELNFRRALKAKAMHLAKPLQLIRADSLVLGAKGQQDDATKAWNFCTALYYKSGATNPWKIVTEPTRPQSCALGIAFYRSRDRQVLHTSLAQIFDELGNGLILRGTPIHLDKQNRVPHLTSNQAYELFTTAIQEYRIALRNFPARVVLHKSSNYSPEEIDGFRQAANELRIDTVDFVTVMDSKLRLFRDGNYPPFRGSLVSLSSKQHILYTRGSVWYYQTYPGMYIPQPLDIRIVRSEESPVFLAREILGLTKMNWNNTQLDGKYPVTLGCARKVGEIMKYLEEGDKPQIRYGFYM